jgi:NAD(P)-dependent dehydrogenase (short-subunit alcohol dehydrogenase family)
MPERIAVITGAPRGATTKVAQQLLQRGFALVINWTPDAANSAALVANLRAAHGRPLFVHIEAESDVE